MIIANTRNLVSPLTGVQRYTSEIVTRAASDIQLVSPVVPLSGLMGHAWEQCILPSKLKGALLWSPANTGPIHYSNQVVTIHDLAVIDHPEWFSKKFAVWYRLMWSLLLKKVAGVITDSHFTKTRLLEYYDLPESKVSVIYLGASTFIKNNQISLDFIKKKYDIDRPYLLCVGSLEPRKNLKRLLDAWALFRRECTDFVLIVVGGYNSLFAKNRLLEQSSVIFIGSVGDEELNILYQHAECFVYPSLYEGFGLPVVEAMTHGVPVITSNKTATAEISGDAAFLINPLDVKDIYNGIKNIMSSPFLRKKLALSALKRSALFSWDHTALETISCIKRIAMKL